MKFVLATLNRDKARELQALLARPGLEIAPLADWPGAVPPEEDGATLADNARIKARGALALTGMPAVADDTGLEVDALGGEPGVRSARYAGPNASDAENVARLLAALAGVPRARRTARFRTVCVALHPDGREWLAEGVLEGRILETPRGSGGFGYDPVFEIADGSTLAEMTPENKNRISHRSIAIRALARALNGI